MLAFVLTLGMVSCKDKAPAEKAKEVAEKVEKATPTLEEIIAQAKAEGANWSVDQWKDAFRNAAINMKPLLLALKEMQDKIGEDPAKAAEFIDQMKEKEAQFEGLGKLMEQFEEVANATENGKKVADDEEWGKQMLQELGLPDDL